MSRSNFHGTTFPICDHLFRSTIAFLCDLPSSRSAPILSNDASHGLRLTSATCDHRDPADEGGKNGTILFTVTSPPATAEVAHRHALGKPPAGPPFTRPG
jgi:hypothetical protein